jgi:hypothetical protein
MKTFLTFLPFLSAASVPSALAAELLGARLPVTLDAMHALAGFVVVLVAQIAFGDYARGARRVPMTLAATSQRRTAKAPHPLAA